MYVIESIFSIKYIFNITKLKPFRLKILMLKIRTNKVYKKALNFTFIYPKDCYFCVLPIAS